MRSEPNFPLPRATVWSIAKRWISKIRVDWRSASEWQTLRLPRSLQAERTSERAAGGRIDAQSAREGRGSTLTVTLSKARRRRFPRHHSIGRLVPAVNRLRVFVATYHPHRNGRGANPSGYHGLQTTAGSIRGTGGGSPTMLQSQWTSRSSRSCCRASVRGRCGSLARGRRFCDLLSPGRALEILPRLGCQPIGVRATVLTWGLLVFSAISDGTKS